MFFEVTSIKKLVHAKWKPKILTLIDFIKFTGVSISYYPLIFSFIWESVHTYYIMYWQELCGALIMRTWQWLIWRQRSAKTKWRLRSRSLRAGQNLGFPSLTSPRTSCRDSSMNLFFIDHVIWNIKTQSLCFNELKNAFYYEVIRLDFKVMSWYILSGWNTFIIPHHLLFILRPALKELMRKFLFIFLTSEHWLSDIFL